MRTEFSDNVLLSFVYGFVTSYLVLSITDRGITFHTAVLGMLYAAYLYVFAKRIAERSET